MDDTVVVILALLFSAFFSGMEIAFVSANKFEIELDKKRGGLSKKIISRFTTTDSVFYNPSLFIAIMLIGNNLALVVYGITLAEIIEDPLIDLVGDNELLVLVLETIISTTIVLVTAEFLPKSIFRISPNKVLYLFAYPLLMVYIVFWPAGFVVLGISEFLFRIFGQEGVADQEVAFGKVDLDHYLTRSTESVSNKQELDPEVQMFHNALNFSTIKARDCMVPRNEIIAVSLEDEIDSLVDLFIETGLSKILIYRDTIDNIIGYAHSKEIFKSPDSIKSILLPINIIPESVTADKVLEDMLEKSRNVAVVVDEFGGTSGMLTMEDIMEEIFGEIEDEHDFEGLVDNQISALEYEFSGRLEIDQINEKYGINVPDSEQYETLSGWVIYSLEVIPKEGDEIKVGPFKVTIIKGADTHIDLLRIKLSEEGRNGLEV